MTFPAAADSVYFLMFGGWESELRSNRWHYARRFAKRLPTVLVQPTGRSRSRTSRSAPEPRIPGCRVLSIRRADEAPTFVTNGVEQTSQILDDMDAHCFERPLLWCYNPMLLGPYCLIPAAARAYHATENYFDVAGLDRFFLKNYRLVLGASDVAIAVSNGVAASLRRNVQVPVSMIRNGCDLAAYSGTSRDDDLVSSSSAFDRVAVYAGNINDRLDYRLVAAAATRLPRTFFAFYGPVRHLDSAVADDWRRLQRHANVVHFGEVESERLPSLYRSADVGLLPYRDEEPTATSGFPLKTLEMAATGLPVVSTNLRELEGLARAIIVTTDADEFVSALESASRVGLGQVEREELLAVCRKHDYDNQFAAVVDVLAQHAGHTVSVRTDVLADAFPQAWRREVNRAGAWAPVTAARFVAGSAAVSFATGRAALLKRFVPPTARRSIARRLFGP